MRVISVKPNLEENKAQGNRVTRGIRKRISGTFLHSDGPQRAHPHKNYSIISTTDRPRTPLAAENSCMKPKMHEHIASTGPVLQEEPEKVFMTRIWVLVRKGMEPQKHRRLEGVIAHEKVSCLRVSVSLFRCPADRPCKELHRAHLSQPGCAHFVC